MAAVNSSIAAELRQRGGVIVADTSPNSLRRSVRYHALKLSRVATACLRILARAGRTKAVYLSVDGGLGAIYACALASVARLAGAEIFLHHHTFRYIESRSALISLLNRCAGSAACNIFLNDTMRVQYRRHYRPFGTDLIVGNAWSMPAEKSSYARPQGAERGCLTIGHMSNLSREKGLFEFIELTHRCRNLGLSVRAILAGPCDDLDGREAIAQAGAALGDRFEYRGPVSGDSKRQFFRDVDVFVFPTNYRFEAQPLVLFEALSFGCAVITKPRGCIAEDLGGHRCVAVIESPDFVSEAAEWLQALQQSQGGLTVIRSAARCLFEQFKQTADRQFAELLERLGRPGQLPVSMSCAG